MNEKSRNMLIRTASGLALTAIVLAAVGLSRWGYALLTGAVTAGGIVELLRMARLTGCSPQRFTSVAGGMLTLGSVVLACEAVICNPALLGACAASLLALAMLLPAGFAWELRRKSQSPMQNLALTYLGIIYIALPMSAAYMIPLLSDTAPWRWNPRAALSYIFIVWANDVFAYLAGITFGRHKMCPRLSPKKSWEGFAGGIAGAVATGAAAAWWMGADAALWCTAAAVAALSGVAGDLVESMFKRSAGIKDSGRIMPGHGGVLDRFDAMLLSAPPVFLVLLIHTLLT